MLVDVLTNLVLEQRAICDPDNSEHRDSDDISDIWKNIATEIKSKGKLSSYYLLIMPILQLSSGS